MKILLSFIRKFANHKYRFHIGIFAIGTIVLASIFQNCSGVSGQLLDPNQAYREAMGIQSASTSIGLDNSTANVKVAVIVDNSNTMTNSNIKLRNSFSNFFDGLSPEAQARVDMQVVLVSTAQVQLNSYESISSPLAAILQNQEYVNTSPRVPASISSGTRTTSPAEDVPGDILGYKSLSSGTSLKRIDFSVAPVRSLAASTSPDVMHQVRGTDFSAIKQDFQDRLAILDPTRLTGPDFYDGTPLGDGVSNESATCALARLLVKDKSFFTGQEIPVVVIVSDEDDHFTDGKNCLSSIYQVAQSTGKVAGFCEGNTTKIDAYKNQTQFNYTVTLPATSSNCSVSKSNMFDVTYSYDPILIDYKTTTITYYDMMTVVRDGQSTQVVNTTPKSLSIDETAADTCDPTRINNLLKSKDSLAIIGDSMYPVGCSQVAKQKVDTSYASSQKASVLNSSQYLTFTDARVTGAGLTASQLYKSNVTCPTALAALMNQMDPAIVSGSRKMTAGTCKISDVRYNNAALRSVVVDNTTNIALANCTQQIATSCAAGEYCEVKYSAGALARDVNYVSSAYNEQGLSCTSPCNTTSSICKSAGTTAIQDYFATQKGGTIKSCTANLLTNVKDFETVVNESLNCNTSCSQTKFCASSPVDTVQSYLARSRPTFTSCATADNGPFSIAFGPVDPKPDSSYCSAGSPRLTTVPDAILDKVSSVSDVDGQTQDLKTYIQNRFKDLNSASSPLITTFVLKPGDTLQGNQSVGTNYIQLASMLGGTSQSVLVPSYATALQNLSGQLDSRISRTLQFPQVDSSQSIIKVYLNNVPLDPSKYSVSGSTLSIGDAVNLQRGDTVTIDFK